MWVWWFFKCRFFIVCLYTCCHWRYITRKGRVGIPLTCLTLPHFCASPKSGPGFPTPYVLFFFVFSCFEKKGGCSFCWYWWSCWPSLNNYSLVWFVKRSTCDFRIETSSVNKVHNNSTTSIPQTIFERHEN